MLEAIQFIQNNMDLYIRCIQQHLLMSIVTIIISILIGVPVGYVCGKKEKASSLIISAVNTFRIIPAIAIFMILIPALGLGFIPALIALVIYALPTVVINTMGAIKSVKPYILESAMGMGMGPTEICFKIELPLALPMILTGIKIATVETVAGASIASFVGAGGLGEIVYMGILSGKTGPLVAGSLTVALLVIVIDLVVSGVQKACTRRL